MSLRGLGNAFHLEHFDHVADLDVVEALQPETALEARLDLRDVVLEPLERGELAFPHDHAVAEQAGLGVALAGDGALGDHAAGNRADLRHLEGIAHLRHADALFLEGRFEQAGHGLLDLVGHVIDDRVLADVHLFAIRHLGGVAIGPFIGGLIGSYAGTAAFVLLMPLPMLTPFLAFYLAFLT